MTNYTLTTDLIADCMALIPENLERLNQKGYTIELTGNDIYFDKPEWNEYFFFNEFSKINKRLEYLAFISHCLSTIPEFQEPNPRYLAHKQLAEENKEIQIDFIKANPNMSPAESLALVEPMVKEVMHGRSSIYEPKTIASATLHGMEWKKIDGVLQLVMMDNPPSTLEELCESYKNVMSK